MDYVGTDDPIGWSGNNEGQDTLFGVDCPFWSPTVSVVVK